MLGTSSQEKMNNSIVKFQKGCTPSFIAVGDSQFNLYLVYY